MELSQTCNALQQCNAGYSAKTLGIHRCTPHLSNPDVGRGRKRLNHDALQCPLAQLACQKTQQEVLLSLRCPRKQTAQASGSMSRRARAANGRKVGEELVDFQTGECRGTGGLTGSRRTQGRVSNADPALPDLPG